jgi:hypothetical protein
MAQKYQKQQVLKQTAEFTATVIGYCHSNYVIVDDTRYSTMSMYTESEVEEIYGADTLTYSRGIGNGTVHERVETPAITKPAKQEPERFSVVKVTDQIDVKRMQDHWLVKQHLGSYERDDKNKPTYFVLEGAARPIVVSSYGDYSGDERYAVGRQLRLNDDGNGTTRFGYRANGTRFTIKAVITPLELPTVIASGKLNFYVVK